MPLVATPCLVNAPLLPLVSVLLSTCATGYRPIDAPVNAALHAVPGSSAGTGVEPHSSHHDTVILQKSARAEAIPANTNVKQHSRVAKTRAGRNGKLKSNKKHLLSAFLKRFADAISERDLQTLLRLLNKFERLFDWQSALIPINGSLPSPTLSHVNVTLLAAAAAKGWLGGVRLFLNRAARESQQDAKSKAPNASKQQYFLNDDGANSTPLLRALEGGHVRIVELLLDFGASPLLGDAITHETPLEAAVRVRNADIVSLLLRDNSELADALALLRVRMRRTAAQLPNVVQRWPIGHIIDDRMEGMRAALPKGLQPNATARSFVGDQPSDWLLLYMNQVMWTFVNSAPTVSLSSNASDSHFPGEISNTTIVIKHLLLRHSYDRFARNFSWNVAAVGLFFALTGLFFYITFQLRVYGSSAAPVSLAHMLPGAFNPVRVTDPDFDPSKLRIKLPYRTVRDHIPSESPCALSHGLHAFVCALFGVFNSWLFQLVRIPPESDIYDEDYMSDDDEVSRLHCRQRSMWRARSLRSIELLFRNVAITTSLCWICFVMHRWWLFLGVVLAYLQYSTIASLVAVSTVPAPIPEMTPDDGAMAGEVDDGCLDAARLVYALFGVQYGPRWARAMATTRSTAAPTSNKLQKRPQHRRLRKRQEKAAESTKACSASEAEEGGDNKGSKRQQIDDIEASMKRLQSFPGKSAMIDRVDGAPSIKAGVNNDAPPSADKSPSIKRLQSETQAKFGKTVSLADASVNHQTSVTKFGKHVSEKFGKALSSKAFGTTLSMKAPYIDTFQRSYLQAGVMHTAHGDYLGRGVFSFVCILFTLLFLLHLGPLFGLSSTLWDVYHRIPPAELFNAYGAPDSGRRVVAVLLELLLIGFITEKLLGIATLLNVACLVLQQRRRSMAFVCDHPPPKNLVSTWGREDSASERMYQAALCVEFATELSGLRWCVLQKPVTLSICFEFVLLLALIPCLAVERYGLPSRFPDVAHEMSVTTSSSYVILYLCACFFWPVFSIMLDGARANLVVREFGRSLTKEMPASYKCTGKDKIEEMMQTCMVYWSGGRAISFAEPCLLLFVAVSGVVALLVNDIWPLSARG